jgi:hypothetical protein
MRITDERCLAIGLEGGNEGNIALREKEDIVDTHFVSLVQLRKLDTYLESKMMLVKYNKHFHA